MASQARRAATDLIAAAVACLLLGSCRQGTAKVPWAGGEGHAVPERAGVRTMSEGYQRTRSHVLVREIDAPTRAALDYAAYHASFMIADPEPEVTGEGSGAPVTSAPFGGLVEKSTLTGDIRQTPLTESEQKQALAYAPLVEFRQARRVAGARALEEVASAIRGESWGLPRAVGVASQAPSEAFLHATPSGKAELWVKIELAPWFHALGALPDQDQDGFPEVYGKIGQDRVDPAAVAALRGEYSSRALGPAEVKAWANQLSSYWYPSFNTDLVPAGPTWPDEHTEADIKRELHGRTFPAPAIVLRGKPQGTATYEVFLLRTGGPPSSAPPQAIGGAPKLAPTRPTPDTRGIAQAVEREVSTEGEGSWAKWAAKLSPFHDAIRRKLRAAGRGVKGLAGADGFLFYRSSLEYVVGGDLESQPAGKNPLPVIVEFKKELDAHGVDFLFVPVPTKVEIFPDEVDPKFSSLVGQVVNPYSRKLLQSLAREGVEVVDLLTPFLAARARGDKGEEPLYQHQDTHWTDRGLRLAADALAQRIKRYPWYPALSQHAQSFGVRETTFTRFGDLYSRLPPTGKQRYEPETLIAHQVLRADGTPYDDDPDSPVVILGDSFTGVYELTDAERAGISAHIARGVGYPVDLVMSYGGGPNVRQKLMRRGSAALDAKKVVVWIMTARDLYSYWERWEPLKAR